MRGLLLATVVFTFAATCSTPEPTDAASENKRPVTLLVPGHAGDDPHAITDESTPDFLEGREILREDLREDLAAYLTAADQNLKTQLPPGWTSHYKFFRGRLPFQWNGDAGIGIQVDLHQNGKPQLTRYLYYQLNAGFSQPISARIRPDRIYGITKDFVVIMPSSSTPESAYENQAVRPVFDRAFQISDANTIRYGVRMPALPADANRLTQNYPDQKAAIAGDPNNQTTYALWVRTLR